MAAIIEVTRTYLEMLAPSELHAARSDDLAQAFRSASDAAYRAVKKPVEGTMLTAIRAMAEAAERDAELAAIIAAGDTTVEETRELYRTAIAETSCR